MGTRSNLVPPAQPWRALDAKADAGAYLSVYLSSDIARFPVRDVTRLGDNKSDPNLETLTYGLFSTCEPNMRKSIADRDIGEIYFLTKLDPLGRALVGMYELGWIAEVDSGDIALAARSVRFIDPIPVDRLTGNVGEALQTRMRGYMIVDEDVAAKLRALVQDAPDSTDKYLSEIRRLERMSYARTGYRYPSWDKEESFTWEDARPYLEHPSGEAPPPNTTPTGAWVCAACGARILNRARLKVCSACKRRGTLEPEVAA